MARITPCLWFDGNAEAAVGFYAATLPDASVQEVLRSGAADGVMSVTFTLAGQSFIALNGGPHFKFTPAISMFVHCADQAEVDRLWQALSDGGQTQRCGWLTDRFGISWQVVPTALGTLMRDPDPARRGRVMRAMLGMTKLDIAGLRQAHAGD